MTARGLTEKTQVHMAAEKANSKLGSAKHRGGPQVTSYSSARGRSSWANLHSWSHGQAASHGGVFLRWELVVREAGQYLRSGLVEPRETEGLRDKEGSSQSIFPTAFLDGLILTKRLQ